MSDPRRLLEGGGSNIERDLLEAGQTEFPDASAKRRAATALAIGAATASVWPTAAYATAKASKAGMPLLMKLLAAGALGAGTLGTVAYVITKPEPPAETAPPVATSTARFTGKARVAERAPPPAAPAEPVATTETPEPAAAPEVRRSPAAPPSPAAASSISEEIRVLDEARRAIAAGDNSAAKRALDEHRRQYPRGALAEEAVLLQIEALARQGKRGAAKSLAERFRASHPNSPHLRRIESVLAEP